MNAYEIQMTSGQLTINRPLDTDSLLVLLARFDDTMSGMWTSHGYWVGDDAPDPTTRPSLSAGCGGPALCTTCALEAGGAQVTSRGPASGVEVTLNVPRSRPYVGEPVHYVSYGTPGGEYASRCRAAIITEVGQWVTVESKTPKSFDRSEGRPIREVEQWWYADACAVAVVNPTGMFFNGAAGVTCRFDDGSTGSAGGFIPGTWHRPDERCQ